MRCWERVVGELGNSLTSSAARVDDLAIDGGCEVDDDAHDDVDTDAHAAVAVVDDDDDDDDAAGVDADVPDIVVIIMVLMLPSASSPSSTTSSASSSTSHPSSGACLGRSGVWAYKHLVMKQLSRTPVT